MFSRSFVTALFVEGVVSGGGMPDADIEPLIRVITNTTLRTLSLSSQLIDLSTTSSNCVCKDNDIADVHLMGTMLATNTTLHRLYLTRDYRCVCPCACLRALCERRVLMFDVDAEQQQWYVRVCDVCVHVLICSTQGTMTHH